MRHLCNTFIDGGEKAEKEWLDPLLKEDIAAIPPVLRVSADVTKMLHALAKCLGEGIELYGKGEGAKGFRPWLEEHAEYKTALYLHPSRIPLPSGSKNNISRQWCRRSMRPLKPSFGRALWSIRTTHKQSPRSPRSINIENALPPWVSNCPYLRSSCKAHVGRRELVLGRCCDP